MEKYIDCFVGWPPPMPCHCSRRRVDFRRRLQSGWSLLRLQHLGWSLPRVQHLGWSLPRDQHLGWSLLRPRLLARDSQERSLLQEKELAQPQAQPLAVFLRTREESRFRNWYSSAWKLVEPTQQGYLLRRPFHFVCPHRRASDLLDQRHFIRTGKPKPRPRLAALCLTPPPQIRTALYLARPLPYPWACEFGGPA